LLSNASPPTHDSTGRAGQYFDQVADLVRQSPSKDRSDAARVSARIEEVWDEYPGEVIRGGVEVAYCKTIRPSIDFSYDEGGLSMETVTISPKFQVVIPKSIREQLGLVPGQKIQAIAYGDRIEFLPERPARDLRGVLRGLDTRVMRDESDRE
jgi:AbrB family looped-hinge helix DNA binding protein